MKHRRRANLNEPGPGDAAAGWFITVTCALERGDSSAEKAARAELARLGINVIVDADCPLRNQGKGEPTTSWTSA